MPPKSLSTTTIAQSPKIEVNCPAPRIADLRQKIDEAKRRLPLPELLAQLGLGVHAKTSARCLWHNDQHPSFSVFKGKDGFWHYKCFVCDAQGGDEITFLVKHLGTTRREAIKRYLEMAGFPPSASPKSREYHETPGSPQPPESPVIPECPESHVHPVSVGHNDEKALRMLAGRNSCPARNSARKKLWQLARDLSALEKKANRELAITEITVAFSEWYRLSQPFLNPAKTYDVYLAALTAALRKVRVPTGEGETIEKALKAVSKLPLSQLPVIPDYPNAPESWRRVTALHRELWRLGRSNMYFLSCRDGARAHAGLSYQAVSDINHTLERFGVIKLVRVGDQRPNGRASEFRYLLGDIPASVEEE